MSDQYHYSPYDYYGPDNSGVVQLLAGNVLDLIGAIPGTRSVCDLGCGTGYLVGRLLDQGHEVVGCRRVWQRH